MCAALCRFIVAITAVTAAACATAQAEMRLVPDGWYQPLYTDTAGVDGDSGKIPVAAFFLDAKTVSNGAFLAFVRAHPRWRKSRLKKLFADKNYLTHWRDDLTLGPDAPADAPVVNVSWFAARAYCRAQGAALPTTAQWELAAAASETKADASDDPDFVAQLLVMYSRPAGHKDSVTRFRNYHGIYDMHGSVWEWVSDFNTAVTSGESRADASPDRQLYCAAGALGAADYRDYPSFLRYGYRSSLDGRYTHGELGFRCASQG